MAAFRDPAKAAAVLCAQIPHAPRDVALRMVAMRLEGPLPRRGVLGALERFFAGLAAAGRAPEQALTEDFAAAIDNRAQLYALLWGLERWAPEVPLAAARPLRQVYDAALNAKYNVRPPRPRVYDRVGPPPGDWPAAWRQARGLLDRKVRIPGRPTLKPLKPKTIASVEQAVGMMAAARLWAVGRGVVLDEAMSPDLVDAFVRFMLTERAASPRTVADYLERIRMLALRSGLIDAAAVAAFGDAIACLRDEQDAAPPAKAEALRAFAERFDLGDVLLRAAACAEKATTLPGHTAEAARLRVKALVFALLVNGGDRQGDLLGARIGRDIVRRPDGLWSVALRQGKTGRRKENDALWPITSSLIDRHILADRPAWRIGEVARTHDGANLLSLAADGYSSYLPTAMLREEFDISGHFVRSLIVNALTQHQPDAAWAAQLLLGHASRTMQATYLTDFRFTAAMNKYHAVIGAVATGPS